ncbi:hypothetical protein DSCO28_26050 [Desulfosarcina ovata subsp. sediminis]|uniref:VOC domain-containing protein n=1 Tax=Desulfosarcina ovata subsp. sediminis TaxID=885957 RepID=A0A5K7ZPZ1_9BACT|nr:VOC family protein [Desulfosarcina ovata]BBO82039.1 hypothetical protein DSCO28_26050 [Desulfosarcina ovata subsp. sediminis]
MQFGSINILVKDPEEALDTYLKLFGTNNVDQVLKINRMSNGVDTVSGYVLKTHSINCGIYTPDDPNSKLGEHLQKNGEGIHHIELHVGQEEFIEAHEKFKSYGWPVSEKPIFIGKLGEAIFWIEETGEQGVLVKFSTKLTKGFGRDGAVYLDTPKSIDEVTITKEYIRPRLSLVTQVIAVRDFKKQLDVWSKILSQPIPPGILDIKTGEPVNVDDGRGDIFQEVYFPFERQNGLTKIGIYGPINDDGPLSRLLYAKNNIAAYNNMTFLVSRDKYQHYWNQLEEAGFAMLDPRPIILLDTGNYFCFVHPISTHGVACEFVSYTILNKEKGVFGYDWSDATMYLVSPDIND